MILPLYKRLAQSLRHQIESGVWLPAEKIPSLRETSKMSGLSLMTVLQAYQLLESQGTIFSLPRSGYYAARKPVINVVPRSLNTLKITEKIDINDAVFDILQAAQNPEIVQFGSAFPDPTLFPQQQLTKSLVSAVKKMSPHSAINNLPPGNDELRRAIAQRYSSQGIDVTPDEIIITSGAMESLRLSLQVATAPGDWVAIESPAFYGILQAIERRNLKVVSIPVDPQQGLDIDALEHAIKTYPIKACCLMSAFQHPTGCSITHEKRQRLINLIHNHGITLIEDDVYSELYFDDERPVPLKSSTCRQNILHCSSFSKCLAPGFRIGWVAAGLYAARIQRLQLMSTLSTSVPMQLALADFMHRGRYDIHLRRLRRQLKSRQFATRHLIEQKFPEGTRISQSSGGYFLWISLPKTIDTTITYKQALQKGISIAPWSMFSVDTTSHHYFRLNASFDITVREEQAISTLAGLVMSELSR